MAELHRERERILRDQEQEIDALLSEEIRQEIAAIYMKFGDQVAAADRSIDELTSAIKTDVLSLKASVASDDLIAVYRSDLVLWNNDVLDGYMAAHPEIRKFRAIGKASVAIQAHRNGGKP